MKFASELLILLAVGVVVGGIVEDRVACRAHDGQPVDWFVMYKLPARAHNAGGVEYVYSDSKTASRSADGWIAAPVTIESPDSMLALTLRAVYSKNADRLVLMYNDEMPNGTSSEAAAHAKGVVAFDAESGFWMTHSVPRYPPAPDDGYSYPTTGTRYGQTVLCVSLHFKQADLIGQQLLYYRPFVYHWQPGKVDVAKLAAVARGDRVVEAPWFRRAEFASRERTLSVVSFAKSRLFGRDIYSEWMSDELRSSLFVETWSNGQGHPMPSNCSNQSNYSVLNVKQVRLEVIGSRDAADSSHETFSSHDDHSKWAVSGSERQPWVCIADINRMESQRHRGGGSLCFRHAQLWRQFHRAADRLEACPLNADHVSLGHAAVKRNQLKLARNKISTTTNETKVTH